LIEQVPLAGIRRDDAADLDLERLVRRARELEQRSPRRVELGAGEILSFRAPRLGLHASG
jgi:hypothetical protein